MNIVVLANKYKVHHLKNLEDRLENLVYCDTYNYNNIMKYDPGLVIVFDEHWGELGNVVGSLVANNIPVLQVMDGILEWRRTWDYSWNGHNVDGIINPINQPALSHKIACLGYKDYTILESWGNKGKCEIIGVPRFNDLINFRKDFSHITKNKDLKVLVVTAKTPYFTEKQHDITLSSLQDLKDYFDNDINFKPIWRISDLLSKEINVVNEINDLTGLELHQVLKEVDVVITTPSTTILEAQLLKIPVITLDYHNQPHYFETAWNIYCKDNIISVMNEVCNPPKEKLDYQDFLLNQQLYLEKNPNERLLELINKMMKVAKGPIKYSYSLLDNSPNIKIVNTSNYKEYYNSFEVNEIDVKKLQLELSAAKGTISILYEKIYNIEKKLNKVPLYKILKRFFR